MPSPFFASVRNLPAPPRLFLVFTAVNVLSWQCIAGQSLVLFARAVGMPPSLVGVLLSFMPLSMLLVAFVFPLVERFGPRRLLLSTWLARNLVAAVVFLMPWAMRSYGPAAGWYVLLLATLGFSLIRAVGVGGWYPWLHELVPREQLGAYFSVETAMSQLVTILVAVTMAQVLALGGGLDRFFWIYGMGIFAGLASVFFIRRIPGGEGPPSTADLCCNPRPASLRRVWADSAYRHYLLLATWGLASAMFLSSAMVMYLRDMLGYGETRIMLLLALGGIGVALTVSCWGRAADRFGSVPAMVQLLAAHSLLALAWWVLAPGWRGTVWLVPLAVLFSLVFNAAFGMVTARGMLCRVRGEDRVGYTALWVVCVSLANGFPPILAGWLIDAYGLAGFRLCFLAAGLGGLAAAGLMFRLSPEEGKPPLHALHHLIRPSQPLRSLGRVFWITLGFGEKGERNVSSP